MTQQVYGESFEVIKPYPAEHIPVGSIVVPCPGILCKSIEIIALIKREL